MKRETIIWTIVLLLAAGWLAYRSLTGEGMGKAYVRAEPMTFVKVEVQDEEPKWVKLDSPEAKEIDPELLDVSTEGISWTRYESATHAQYKSATLANPAQSTYSVSIARSIGVWVAAFFTLAIFSFAYKDNPMYRLAEAILVGVSAAYWMVVGFWDVLVPNLIGRVIPAFTKSVFLPGLEGRDTEPNYLYIVPLILGVMLLWRLSPRGAWIARWPLAFIIGTTAGIRLMGFIHADFLSQIRATIVPLVVTENGSPMFWESLANFTIVVGVLACLVYFFFSIEHKGIVGKTARVGIWFLMITFGAAFGYTVMGRIALLAIRLEFLFDDWLWLINPMDKRLDEAAALLWMPIAALSGCPGAF